jgi:ABC-type bacteriocin/lantibiotic exporter with double-glycine peptidase domain
MVLDSSGKPYNLNRLIVDSKVTSQGSYMGDMARALRNQGLDTARVKNRVTIDALAEATSRGNPAIAAVRLDRGGHAIVVDGFTTRRGQRVVSIRDPALGRQYFTPLSEFADRFSGQAILTNPIKP